MGPPIAAAAASTASGNQTDFSPFLSIRLFETSTASSFLALPYPVFLEPLPLLKASAC